MLPLRILSRLTVLVTYTAAPGYASFRYPSGQAGYMTHEHTPASSAVTSPAVDAPNPMDLCEPDCENEKKLTLMRVLLRLAPVPSLWLLALCVCILSQHPVRSRSSWV
jgi:hypothetical protein